MAIRPEDVLSAAQWERVHVLFPEAQALAADARGAFLDRHCRHDPALRAELESLLEAARNTACLDRPVLVQPIPVAPLRGSLDAGSRIGAWRIVRLLGRGGMGEVYLAERVEGGFAQTAAIKLLRIDAGEHAERFEAERRILAQLEHPNIARLLDGGIDDAGRAWMAMEYVAGQTLATHCRQRRAGLATRLALFDQVCAAVAYAHAHLVVHRDLKPANILVTDAAQVKLLDFGVAKLLALEGDAPMTQTQAAMLTPAHAAPEQLEGGAVTTATDVYALGVLLYEMLCGQRPWRDGDGLVAGLAERLTRGEPRMPSAAAAQAAPVPPREVRGDLDAIVMRCLRQLPANRYPGVEVLREDLRRHARHEPVVARLGARGYVLRRWIRRHRLGVAATAAVFLALVAGIGATLWQARIARGQALRADLVKSLVLNVFREGDPLTRPGSAARPPAEMVADGIAAANRKLGATPALHADVLDDLGEVQANLGDLAGGRATLAHALALRRQVHAGDAAATAGTLRRLATVQAMLGAHDEALASANAARSMLARLGQANSLDAARATLVSGVVLMSRKDREGALWQLEQAQVLLAHSLGRDDPETAFAVMRQAQALDQLRRDGAAEAAARDAVARLERSLGTDSVRLVQPLVVLAAIVAHKEPDAAIAVYQRAAELARAKLGPRNTIRASVLSRMANAYRLAGKPAQAEPLYGEALAAMPEGAAEHANLLAGRGQLYLETQHFDAAARDLAAAFDARRRTLGEGAGITWYTASLRGSALAGQGMLAEAERMQRDALARLQKLLGPDAYQNTLLIDRLVETLTARGKHAEAVTLARRSLELAGHSYPATHQLVVERSLRLAVALVGAGGSADLAEAAERCGRAERSVDGQRDGDSSLAGRVRQACLALHAPPGAAVAGEPDA